MNMKKLLMAFSFATAFIVAVCAADIDFSWSPNPPAEMVSTYVIEYKKTPGVTNWTVLTSVPGTTNIATVKGLQAGYKYEFRAFAVNAVGKGTNQSTVIQIPTNAPTVVTNFIATPQ
jgi:hypothetical protein